jgi:hypothetical protein
MNDKRNSNKIAKTLTTTGNPDAAIGEALAETKSESVSSVANELAETKAMMAAILANQNEIKANQAQLLVAATTPKTRTVRVSATGEQVVSSGKRGKPPTAGLDDCRDADGKVRKVGVRAYLSECSGDRVGTYVFASRGAIGSGKGETISKVAACPYDDRQIAMINQIEQSAAAKMAMGILSGRVEQTTPAAVAWEREAVEWEKMRLRRIVMEPWRRWASGFACLCFVLVGAPMAIRMRNADFLTSFFLCFLPILLMYYPMFMFGLSRVKSGAMPPPAVWLGNVLITLWGIWLLRRVIRN